MTELGAGFLDAGQTLAASSFDAFYRREWASAVRYGWVLTGSVPVAEDLAQDAFVSAQKAWDKVGSYDQPDAWIRRAMTNRSTSLARRFAREAKAKLRLRPDVRISVEMPEQSDHLWDAVRQLSPRQMHVVALAYLDDRSDQQIASILEIGVETARTHRRRGLARLAELLDEPDGMQTPSPQALEEKE